MADTINVSIQNTQQPSGISNLKELKNYIDTISEDINSLNVGQERLDAEIDGIKRQLKDADSSRPTTNLYIGQQFFDTTLNKPIYWNGTKWVDSNGFTATWTRGNASRRAIVLSQLDADDNLFQYNDVEFGLLYYVNSAEHPTEGDWYSVQTGNMIDE